MGGQTLSDGEQPWSRIAKLKQRDPTGQTVDQSPQTLAEVLAFAKDRVLLLLDVKPQTDANLLMAEVDKAGAVGRVMFLAYTIPQAQALRRAKPDAVLALPIFDRDQLAKAKAAGLVDGRLLAMARPGEVDATFIPELEAFGATVMSGTYASAKSPDALYRTRAVGAESGDDGSGIPDLFRVPPGGVSWARAASDGWSLKSRVAVGSAEPDRPPWSLPLGRINLVGLGLFLGLGVPRSR